jgi:hypothetical protein
MKYSIRERKSIYLESAERIKTGTETYCCDAISETTFNRKGWVYPSRVVDFFPEFALFTPKKDHTIFWFGKDQKAREIALLLCAAMCDDKPEHP